MAIEKGKIITITSVKGGVGKTTFLLSLAHTYKKLNKKVLIIDCNSESEIGLPFFCAILAIS